MTTGVTYITYPELPGQEWGHYYYTWPWTLQETLAYHHGRNQGTGCRWVTPTHFIDERRPGIHQHLIIHNPQEALPDL